jgi:polyhydroxyalkanoate synthesis regulator phasin
MTQNDLLKRLLDAGMTFTAMTQARAEALIQELVRAGEVQAEQAKAMIDELVERSQRNSERLIDAVRGEIQQQMANLGLATKADITRLERKIADVSAAAGTGAATRRPAKKAPAKKAGAKQATASRSTAGKTSAKKASKAGRSSQAAKASKSSTTRSAR